MKVLGIIGEYNPMHNGHIYHIEKSKKICNTDYTILIMSGSFTQNGNIAIIDKFTRAKIACNHGIDLVIELPIIYSISSAKYFASSAIRLLDKLNIVNYLSFGSEEPNIEKLNNIAQLILDNEILLYKYIKEELKNGVSFPIARQNSINRIINNQNIMDIISKPNNILALEYIMELKKINSTIIPINILRENNFNSDIIDKNLKYISATAIRKHLINNEIDVIKKFIPEDIYNIFKHNSIICNEKLFEILKYKIISSNINELNCINEVTEGLENRIKKYILYSSNYKEFLFKVKSKRYNMTKIKRMLLNIILDIKKDKFNSIYNSKYTYLHVLSTSNNGKKLLGYISKNSSIPLITSISDSKINSYEDNLKYMIKKDILSTNIHSIVTNSNLNMDYFNKL